MGSTANTWFKRSETARSVVTGGDVLLTTSGNCGQVAMVDDDPAGTVCVSNFLRVLRVNRAVAEPRYLYHYINRKEFRHRLAPFIRGSTIQNLSVGKALAGCTLPLPSIEEQRRSAAILDRAELLRAKRRETLVYLDEVARSIFHDLFGGTAHKWSVRSLAELAQLTSGGTPDRSVRDHFGGDIPWVKSGELTSGRMVVGTDEQLTEMGVTNSSAKVQPPGTVLVAMYGATAGACAILGVDAATNQAVCCVQTGKLIRPQFLLSFLQGMTSELLSRRAGGAQPNLSQSIIRDLKIPVPPVDQQLRFERLLADIDRLRDVLSASLERLNELFCSCSDRAFAGEL